MSPNSTRKNLENIVNNLPTVYDEILSCNFPKISKKLPLFKGASRLILAYSLKDKYITLNDAPRLHSFYFKSDEPEKFEINFFDMDEQPSIIGFYDDLFISTLKRENKEIKLDGKVYRPLYHSYNMLNFIFNETPMLNYIYSTLTDDFKIFFENWKKNNIENAN